MADAAEQRRIVVLISGSGTNLQALIDAQDTPALPNARIVLVLSNRKAAYGLTRAQKADPPIATHHLALQTYLKAPPKGSSKGELEGEEGEGEGGGPPRPRTRATYDAEIARIVLDARPDVVVLAGWMHVFGDDFLDAVCPSAPVINLHPALPGAFDGTRAIERGYEAFQRGEVDAVGAMVHRVVKEVDRGEPVVVREVEIRKGEPLAAYEERLHRTEWEIVVEATRKVLGEIRPT